MAILHINGRITETGELEVRLPRELPPGEARVTIEYPVEVWSPGEIKELLQVEPMSGAEIIESDLTGGWADRDIADGQGWVEEQRDRRRRQRTW